MKKSILILALSAITLSAFSQTGKQAKQKPGIQKADSAKKQKMYTLYVNVDSAGYVNVTQQLAKISQHLEQSDSPHKDVQGDQNFLNSLFKLWYDEKKEQDKQTTGIKEQPKKQ